LRRLIGMKESVEVVSIVSRPDTHIATGLQVGTGNGLVHTLPRSAEVGSDMRSATQSPWVEIFRPSRTLLRALQGTMIPAYPAVLAP